MQVEGVLNKSLNLILFCIDNNPDQHPMAWGILTRSPDWMDLKAWSGLTATF